MEVNGESNHLLVLLQSAKDDYKPPSPFKFNTTWLEDEDFIKLINYECKTCDASLKESTISSLLPTLRN
jgi:hypothetical protein